MVPVPVPGFRHSVHNKNMYLPVPGHHPPWSIKKKYIYTPKMFISEEINKMHRNFMTTSKVTKSLTP